MSTLCHTGPSHCSGSEERNGSAVDKQCVKQFLTAQGVQGRRRLKQERKRKLKCLLFSPLLWVLLRRGYFIFFFTLAWRDRGLGLPSDTNTHSVSLYPVCMSLCMSVCENGSQWAWVGKGVYMWVTLQACKWVLVCKTTSFSTSLFSPSIYPSSLCVITPITKCLLEKWGIMPTFIYA